MKKIGFITQRDADAVEKNTQEQKESEMVNVEDVDLGLAVKTIALQNKRADALALAALVAEKQEIKLLRQKLFGI